MPEIGYRFRFGLVLVAFLLFCISVSRAAVVYVPNDYPTIQQAVDAATAGDTIVVRDGVYVENIDINKPLTITSENGSANCIVQAADPYDYAFEVTADYVNITGFTVEGATAGLFLYFANHCNVSNNSLSNNEYGISLYESEYNIISNNILFKNEVGISLDGSDNNIISNNNCHSNGYGISLGGDNNTVSNNNCINNHEDGISLGGSDNNIISNNNCHSNGYCGIDLWWNANNNLILNNYCSNNKFGIRLSYSKYNKLTGNFMVNNGIVIGGSELVYYIHEIDTSNTVNGKPVYYWKHVDGGKIPDGAGQVILVNCRDIVIEEQNLSNASVGVELAFSSNITIKNNDCSGNIAGINIRYSSNNTVSTNNCSNSGCGICLFGSRLFTSKGNIILNNYCSNSGCGISLDYSNMNLILNNNCSNCYTGINIYESNNNIISGNNCSNNNEGISLGNSDNNIVNLNSFIDNVCNVDVYSSANIWNSTQSIAYTYNGLTYTNYLGNYWSDYRGGDTNNDGVGDIPYQIDSDYDYYPLMQPAELLARPIKTATGTGTAYLSSSAGVVENLKALSEVSLPENPSADFPHGLFAFRITGLNPGENVDVTITLPSNLSTSAEYWKYGSTSDNPTPHWYRMPLQSNDGDNVIVITLQDGGLGDDDLIANGVIVDAGGPGIPSAQPTPIPELTLVGILISVLSIVAVLFSLGRSRES